MAWEDEPLVVMPRGITQRAAQGGEVSLPYERESPGRCRGFYRVRRTRRDLCVIRPVTKGVTLRLFDIADGQIDLGTAEQAEKQSDSPVRVQSRERAC